MLKCKECGVSVPDEDVLERVSELGGLTPSETKLLSYSLERIERKSAELKSQSGLCLRQLRS